MSLVQQAARAIVAMAAVECECVIELCCVILAPMTDYFIVAAVYGSCGAGPGRSPQALFKDNRAGALTLTVITAYGQLLVIHAGGAAMATISSSTCVSRVALQT